MLRPAIPSSTTLPCEPATRTRRRRSAVRSKQANGAFVSDVPAVPSRYLAAVMFADMVGYSARMAQDEQGTLRLLETLWGLLRPVLALHQGREVKTIGDALMVEFGSALAAMLCASRMQAVLHEHNSGSGSSERLLLRIGVHIGD